MHTLSKLKPENVKAVHYNASETRGEEKKKQVCYP